MRLVVFGPGHPFRGGIARTTTELVRALEARGHQIAFLTPIRQYPGWLYPGVDDRDPDACPRLDSARQVLDPMVPTSWPAARHAGAAAGAEAWVVPYWTWAWSGLWLAILHGPRRPPAVAVVHNPVDHESGLLQRAAARLVLGRCQALFTHARILGDGLRQAGFGVPVASHPLPPIPIPPLPDREPARAELGLPEDGRVALYLGLIRPYKGVDLLVDAFARLPRELGWHLVVAGEPWGGLGQTLRRQVARLGLGDRVRLDLRWVGEAEMSRLLAAADVAVLPYRGGSQSAVAPLALAHGVPVVSTAVGGLPEIVEDRRNGLVVAPGSVPALTEALSALDQATLQGLAAGARESAGRLSWGSYAAALEGLIERVV